MFIRTTISFTMADIRAFEDMADGPDVERRLAARDVEMVDIPDMPQQVGYMPQGNIHCLGISPHAMSAAHVAAPGDLNAEILDIEFLHVRRFEIVA